jgi:tungstate transport system permease protein
MEELWYGLVRAVQLIVTLDPEVIEITGRSLSISVTSTVLSALFCLPLGSVIHFYSFPGRRTVISLIQTFYSVPTVVVGLIIFVLFSRAGPLGSMGLLFTPTVMVIGQMLLVAPVLLGLMISGISGVDRTISDTARSLGASGTQTAWVIVKEARFAVMAAVILAFGRAVSEVGLALMVGGNIRGFTRVITTAISLETSKGDIELPLALGIILIAIALVINLILNRIQQR